MNTDERMKKDSSASPAVAAVAAPVGGWQEFESWWNDGGDVPEHYADEPFKSLALDAWIASRVAARASAPAPAQDETMRRVRELLNRIASWKESAVVDGSFDGPHAASDARLALALLGTPR